MEEYYSEKDPFVPYNGNTSDPEQAENGSKPMTETPDAPDIDPVVFAWEETENTVPQEETAESAETAHAAVAAESAENGSDAGVNLGETDSTVQVSSEESENASDGVEPPISILDTYADGTPVRPRKSAEPGSSSQQAEEKIPDPYVRTGNNQNLKQYQYGSDWQNRQINPQPMSNGSKQGGSGKGIAILLCILIALAIGLVGAVVMTRMRSAVTTPEDVVIPEASSAESESPVIENPIPTVAPSENSETSIAETTYSVADVAEQTMPAMVSITTMSVQQVYSFFGQNEYREVESAGSGIIVGQTEAELLIATNDHVIADSRTLSVCFIDDEVVEGVVKGTDTENDLAIVAVAIDDIPESTKSQIRVINIGDSDALRLGDQVIAIGNALGFGQSLTVGYVSALNRTVTVDGEDHVLLQTDAAINPGNSGGALLNMKGELIGINEVKYVAEDTEGIGYAIPITFAKPILDELMNRQTRTKVKDSEAGYLGITCLTVTSEYAKAYRIPTGVFVDSVVEGGPAEKAGMQQRDIITAIGDITVTTTEELLDEMKYHAAGETIEVTVSRLGARNEYEEVVLSLVLEKKPEGYGESVSGNDD